MLLKGRGLRAIPNWFAALCAVCFVSPAQAQDVLPASPAVTAPIVSPDGRVISYPPSYFSSFQPQTARDMVERLPGFTLTTETGARGLGSNPVNVTINSQRPAAKSDGIEGILSRITAARVTRIDLIRGGNSSDAQGQRLVANLVVANGAGSGTATLTGSREPRSDLGGGLDVNYQTPIGAWNWTGGITLNNTPTNIRSVLQRFDSAADLSEALEDNGLAVERNVALTMTVSRDLAGGTLSTNMRLARNRERIAQKRAPVFSDVNLELFRDQSIKRDGEFGMDWSGRIGRDHVMTVSLLGRTGTSDVTASATSNTDTSTSSDRTKTTELVARATVKRGGDRRFTGEFGTELAYNRRFSNLTVDLDGVPVALPGSNIMIRELRNETFANATLRLGVWQIESNVALELSQIGTDDATSRKRNLSFIKPSLVVSRAFGDATDVRLEARRTVGQLDFDGFVASTDFINDRPIAGNAELRPEVTDSFTLSLDHRLGQGGALNLNASRQIIRDALAFVPLTNGGQAQLNFGDIKLWTVSGSLSLPLNRFAKGARLDFSGDWTGARRPDELTGIDRNSGRSAVSFATKFRHDLTQSRIAYGFGVYVTPNEQTFFVDEISRVKAPVEANAFIETTALLGYKITLSALAGLGKRSTTRVLFDPDRSGAIDFSERVAEQGGIKMTIILVRQF